MKDRESGGKSPEAIWSSKGLSQRKEAAVSRSVWERMANSYLPTSIKFTQVKSKIKGT